MRSCSQESRRSDDLRGNNVRQHRQRPLQVSPLDSPRRGFQRWGCPEHCGDADPVELARFASTWNAVVTIGRGSHCKNQSRGIESFHRLIQGELGKMTNINPSRHRGGYKTGNLKPRSQSRYRFGQEMLVKASWGETTLCLAHEEHASAFLKTIGISSVILGTSYRVFALPGGGFATEQELYKRMRSNVLAEVSLI